MTASGCALETSEEDAVQAAPSRVQAFLYPEAVLVDGETPGKRLFACTGAVLAPRVVLTAGHCINGIARWRITAPYAGVEPVFTTEADTSDYVSKEPGIVNPAKHDVGLLFLPKPIALKEYPMLSQVKVADGQSVVVVGRRSKVGGKVSTGELFVTDPFRVGDATEKGFPLHYSSVKAIDPGDSGGPCLVAASSPHLIVAVNSGTSHAQSEYARTDGLVYRWIQQAIEAHGGFTLPAETKTEGDDAGAPEGGGSEEVERP